MLPLVRLSQLAITRCLSRFRQRIWLSRGFCDDGPEIDDESPFSDHETLDFHDIDPNAFIGGPTDSDEEERDGDVELLNPRKWFLKEVRLEADRVFEVLQQDGLGFDFRPELLAMQVKVNSSLVREVLLRILKSINDVNKSQSSRLAYKFFTWAGQQEEYSHNTNGYNLILKIFAECDEFKAMWRLVDEMNQNGLPTTARTLNILICSCGQAGMKRKLVTNFLKSKTFTFRRFKNSFNAILHSLVCIKQYRLIEWVYQQMQDDGYAPDILTYNVLLWTKYRLSKLNEFQRLVDQMYENGLAPDLHTYNLLLHLLGKGDKPLAALKLLDHMEAVGCQPRVIHYTALIDGLSRGGNLEASRYFYDEMVKKGCERDVVCYTVMISSHVVAGEPEKAQQIFDDMITKGHLPNVLTYNSMIRGLCMVGKFTEARSMLREMEHKGCTPNFSLYSAIVRRMRNAGKISEAQEVIENMMKKGRYLHLLPRFDNYRRL